MIISRGYICRHLFRNVSQNYLRSPKVIPIRQCSEGTWRYRSPHKPSEEENRHAEVFGTCLWGWIFYHLINDYGMMIGENEEIDPSSWTDEELGIPPDDA